MIAIVGAGPAGIAAACAAAESGAPVTLIDENPVPGGQIWRGAGGHRWRKRLEASRCRTFANARVVDVHDGELTVEQDGSALSIAWEKLILAPGARELFVPFPGWTLPGVMGAGGLQALAKSGLDVHGKRVVVAGTGPLLLAVAGFLRSRGAHIVCIAEQAPRAHLFRFGGRLIAWPGKIAQFIALQWKLGGVSYLPDTWVERAEGNQHIERVVFHDGTRERCDLLATGYGLYPNVELALALGCEMRNGAVYVDTWQETSRERVYCAGECTGIGGVDKSLVEGEIAGYAAARKMAGAEALFDKRDRALRFAAAMNEAFALRDELRALPDASTVICRCEDVRFAEIQGESSWREAKLQTRCGMGPCQGRVCGAAADFLFGWRPDFVRPPLFPARTGSLIKHKEASR